jgi:hypothetical protein
LHFPKRHFAPKLNQFGATHLIIPIVAVLVVGGIGGYFISQTHAASYEGVGIGGSKLCLRYSSAHSTVTAQPCLASDSGQHWSISGPTVRYTTTNSDCLTASGSSVVVHECGLASILPASQWAPGPYSGTLYSVSTYNGNHTKKCLTDAGLVSGGNITLATCSSNADQHFANITLPAKAPAPAPVKIVPVQSASCVKNTYQVGSSGATCIDTIQSILTATYNYYHVAHAGTKIYPGLPVNRDGIFGTATQTEVKVFQTYFMGKSAADGVVGPATWQDMCSVAYYHDGNSDYKTAGCTGP